ncbi:MAG: NB-ARC domain-containing protein, partial [Cyanobacteria bacterium J06555_13]
QKLDALDFADDISEQQRLRQGKALRNDIRHDLKLLEAIGFLEDHRVKRQGKSIWHFTLKLCSLDPVANLTKIQSQWALYKNNRLAPVGGVQSSRAEQTSPSSVSLHHDWSDAPDIQHFFGRAQDLTTLKKWAVEDSCRLIAIVGMHGIGKTRLSIKLGKGGIGKTDLSLQLARGIQSQFQLVIWRSLINAPQIDDFLTDLVKALSQQAEVTLPTDPKQKISRLLHYLKLKKCLLILDNVESILEGDTQTGNYRSGYEDYGHLLKQIGSVPHQSCVLLTSREEPINLLPLEGKNRPVRFLHLSGLDLFAGQKILETIGDFIGSDQDWQHLIDFYNGNPLALELAAHHIQKVFQGNIAQFLQTGKPIFQDLRELLDWHFERLTTPEKEVLIWLAIEREPVTITALRANIVSPLANSQLPQTLSSLQSRLPLETSTSGFTLQPVLMEYVTEHLIESTYQEILTVTQDNSALNYLHCYALIQATAKDYVRQNQKKLIAQPILDKLLVFLGNLSQVKSRLERVLKASRDGNASPMENRQFPHSGYAAGNILNLLHQLQIDLSGQDFSHLTVRQAYLQGTNLQGCNFSHAHFHQTSFTQTFKSLRSIAFNPTGDTLAFGDVFGHIYLWDTATGKQKQVFQD